MGVSSNSLPEQGLVAHRVRDGVVRVVPEDRRLIRPGRPVDLSAVVTNSLGWAHARRVAGAVTTGGLSGLFSQPCSATRQVTNTRLCGCFGGGPGRTRAAGLPAREARWGRLPR
jgi:hypothetical protein